jgi:O-antigen ligase
VLKKAWLVVLAGVVLVPLVTWFPMLAYRFPRLGLPVYPLAQGGDLWEMQTFWLVALGLLALIVGASDKWLGVAVALSGLLIWIRGAAMDPTHSVIFALGGLCLVTVRAGSSPAWASRARWLLVGCGAFQVVYILQQKIGYDVLWGPLLGGTLNKTVQPIGTLLGVDIAASYVAILAPLMPLWLLPFALYVVVTSQSLGAIVALAVGLTVAYRPWRHPKVAVAAVCVLLAVGAYGYQAHVVGKQTQHARVGIWKFAGERWVRTDPILGYGLGGWATRVPAQQIEAKYAPTNELWREAHNEPLQWLVETGVVGLFLLGLWLYDYRRMFLHPEWGASIAALAASCLTFHPFHVVASALLGILLIGLATPHEEECPA